MASKTILKDGEVLIENYGYDLENLQEGDTVGIMRTSQVSKINLGFNLCYNLYQLLNCYFWILTFLKRAL